MKSLKKLLSAMLLGVLLVTNVVPVSAAEVQPLASAPPLTEFYVYSVYSQNGGLEYIDHSGTTAQVGTRNDHGGTWIEITTVEIGYAKSRTATFNNNSMTLKAKTPIDTNHDSIVDGYYCTWRYENAYGFETGTFRASATSANTPWNTRNIIFYVY